MLAGDITPTDAVGRLMGRPAAVELRDLGPGCERALVGRPGPARRRFRAPWSRVTTIPKRPAVAAAGGASAVLERIVTGTDLIVPLANGEPVSLRDAAEAHASELEAVRVHQMHVIHDRPYLHGIFGDRLRHVSDFRPDVTRPCFRAGTIDLVPNNFDFDRPSSRPHRTARTSTTASRRWWSNGSPTAPPSRPASVRSPTPSWPTAWSVSVAGAASEIDSSDDLFTAQHLGLFPLARRAQAHFVHVVAAELSGRRFHAPYAGPSGFQHERPRRKSPLTSLARGRARPCGRARPSALRSQAVLGVRRWWTIPRTTRMAIKPAATKAPTAAIPAIMPTVDQA